MPRKKPPLQDLVCKGCGVTVRTHNRNRSFCSDDCRRIYSFALSPGVCLPCGIKDADRGLAIWFTAEMRDDWDRRVRAFADVHEQCRREDLDNAGRSTLCPCVDCRRSRGEAVPKRQAGTLAARISSPEFRRNRRLVLDRDGWICQLCFLPIDADAHPHDDLASAVDHILRVEDGGADDLENLRAAHRWCNIRREHPWLGELELVRQEAHKRFAHLIAG